MPTPCATPARGEASTGTVPARGLGLGTAAPERGAPAGPLRGRGRPTLRSPDSGRAGLGTSAAAIEQLHTNTATCPASLPPPPGERGRGLSERAHHAGRPSLRTLRPPPQLPGVPQASRAGLPCPAPPAPAAARPGLPAEPLRAAAALLRARPRRAPPALAALTCRAPGATDTVWDPPGNDTQRTAPAANRSAPGAGRVPLPANRRPRCPAVGGARRDAAGAAKGGRRCPPCRAPRGFVYIGDLARAAVRRGPPLARGAGRGGTGRWGRIGGEGRAAPRAVTSLGGRGLMGGAVRDPEEP